LYGCQLKAGELLEFILKIDVSLQPNVIWIKKDVLFPKLNSNII
jgi:hypothetical protein